MRNIEFINAGAGSGKTFFLSGKLTEVVSQNLCRADEIILTTFTEAAAAELKNKAREALFKAGNPEQANLLASAAMGTIHSVAFQMIQRYWYIPGEGVNLRVMPEEDRNFFLNQSLAFIPTPEELNKLEKLSRDLDFQKGLNQKDPDRWRSDLLDIIGKALNNRMETLKVSKEASLEELDRLFPVDPTWAIDNEMAAGLVEESIPLLQNAKQSDTVKKQIKDAEKLKNLKGKFEIPDYIDLQAFLKDLQKYIVKGLKRPENLEKVKDSLAKLHKSQLFISTIRDYITLIFTLAERSMIRYREYKREHRLIDFNDMEDMFLRLLENDKARDEISKRYKIVFVDEFQDCSPMQVEIFCKLSDLVQQSYWVGDPKQAVYDFRGTDPLLIEAIIRKLSGMNDQNLSLGKRLEESWRSRPEIVQLANNVFTPALADQVDPDSIALRAVRNADELTADDLHRPLQYWAIKGNANNNPAFVHHLAAEITALTGKGQMEVMDKAKSRLSSDHNNQIVTRKMVPRDIAVLCRTNVTVNDLARALKKFGIQVAAEQDNLAGTAEMALFLALLNYYLDKNDTLARATIRFLSEPGLDTAGLIDERLEFLYEENEFPRDIPDDDTEGRKRYYEWLGTWGTENPMIRTMDDIREHSGHLSVSSLVDKVVTMSGITDVALCWDNPLQRRNNLEALKKIARDYENRCLIMDLAASLRGFIQSLTFYGNESIKQGAAAGTDSVNVMTYHKAKGLEWPVVILANLDYDHYSDRNLMARGFFGISLDSEGEIDLDNPYRGKKIILMPWPFGALNKKVNADLRNKVVMEARYQRMVTSLGRELKRLLYVGATRARDIMITVSYNGNDLKWINDMTGPRNVPASNVWGTEDVVLTSETDYGADDEYPEPRVRQATIFEKNGPVEQGNPKWRSPSKLGRLDGATVTLLENFKFRIETGGQGNREDDMVGNCLHSLFYSFIPGNLDHFMKMAPKVIAGFGLAGELTFPEHIYKVAANLHEFLTAKYGAPVGIYKELPLQAEENGTVWSGSADLVWETESTLVLVDYKSYPGKIDSILNHENDHYAGIYSGQLDKYRRMIDAGHPGGKIVSTMLIYYAVMGVIVEII